MYYINSERPVRSSLQLLSIDVGAKDGSVVMSSRVMSYQILLASSENNGDSQRPLGEP